MSIRNYHAFIRAARKHGGLSLPAARKVAKKVAARLDRPVRGVDVQKHPRIFRESLSANARRKAAGFAAASKRGTRAKTSRPAPATKRGGSGGISASSAKRVARIPGNAKSDKGRLSSSGRKSSRETRQAGPPGVVVARQRRARLEREADLALQTEYVSTPEYKKGGPKGGSLLQLQIHIIGPPGLRKSQLDKVAERWLTNGSTPPGIEVKALGWNGKNPTQESRGMRVARSNFRHIPFTF